MNILITGAAGQLGRALIKEIDYYNAANMIKVAKCACGKIKCNTHGLTQLVRPIDYILTGHREMYLDEGFDGSDEAFANEDRHVQALDITDENAVNEFVFSYMPDVIVNCAAYNAVDKAEEEPEAANLLNGKAPGFLAKAADAVGAKIVHVSTDYVFSGEGDKPLTEKDEPCPQTAYGKSKLLGEQSVASACKKHFIIRTAWLFGEGKNFVRTMINNADRQLRVVDDQTGCPTSASELARLIVYLFFTEKYGIWHGVCEGSTTWYGFAKKIFEFLGKNADIIPIGSMEYVCAAKRPAYSVLENARIHTETDFTMLSWEEALKEYLDEYFKSESLQ
jgi:dTDP-4-dehydrorhamnose reductase